MKAARTLIRICTKDGIFNLWNIYWLITIWGSPVLCARHHGRQYVSNSYGCDSP